MSGQIDLSDPLVWAAGGAALVVLVLLLTLRASLKFSKVSVPPTLRTNSSSTFTPASCSPT